MGQPGDLLLVFADALTRSWKQIIKFRPEGMPVKAAPALVAAEALSAADPQALVREAELRALMEGTVRDERGIVFAREQDD